MNDQMAADHRDDYEAKSHFDDAKRAIDIVLLDDHHIGSKMRFVLGEARDELAEASAHIVRAWD